MLPRCCCDDLRCLSESFPLDAAATPVEILTLIRQERLRCVAETRVRKRSNYSCGGWAAGRKAFRFRVFFESPRFDARSALPGKGCLRCWSNYILRPSFAYYASAAHPARVVELPQRRVQDTRYAIDDVRLSADPEEIVAIGGSWTPTAIDDRRVYSPTVWSDFHLPVWLPKMADLRRHTSSGRCS